MIVTPTTELVTHILTTGPAEDPLPCFYLFVDVILIHAERVYRFFCTVGGSQCLEFQLVDHEVQIVEIPTKDLARQYMLADKLSRSY